MEIVTTIAPIALAIIMLCLGASLTVSDFSRVIKNPKDFFIGFVCQLFVLPLVAYLLIIILKVPTEMALGVMLIAAAPGGVTSNVLTKFADGDVALSVSLTAFMSLLSIISVPFIIFLSSFTGLLFVLPSLILKKRKLNSQIPFGPFLILGLTIYLLFQSNLSYILQIL